MKPIIFLFLSILNCTILIGQTVKAEKCDYAMLFKQGIQAAKDSMFDKALLCFNSARRCNPLKGKEVDDAIEAAIRGIQKQKRISDEKKALAERKTEDEKKAREFAEKETKIRIAGELAATAREVWATERDSLTALRLAEAAIKVSTPPTAKAIESLRDIVTAAFTHPIKSINLVKRYVHSKKDLENQPYYFPFSPQLKYFISNSNADNSNSIRIWQLSNGQVINKFVKQNQTIGDFIFSQNDKYVMMIVFSSGGKITEEVFDVTSGKLLFTYQDTLTSTIKKIFFLDNRPMLFYQSDSLYKILDISNNTIVKTIPQIKNFNLSDCQFSGNGKRLVIDGTIQDMDSIGMVSRKLIKIWDLEKNIFSYEFKLKRHERYVAFATSKDNKFLAIAYKTNSIDIIDLESNQVVKKFTDFNSNITNLVFSDDSKYLLSGDIDGQIKFWSIEWSLSIQTFNIQNRPDVAYHIAISTDNKNIYTYSLGTINVWRTIVDILDKKNSPTLTEDERRGYGIPDWIKD